MEEKKKKEEEEEEEIDWWRESVSWGGPGSGSG